MPRLVRMLGLLALVVLAVHFWPDRSPQEVAVPAGEPYPTSPQVDSAHWPAGLPPEALATLAAIERGGPFPYRQDGRVFENRERLLPAKPRGYYREYTVDTPGSRDRGARRIVTGGEPPETFYYTEDHYRSFRSLETRR